VNNLSLSVMNSSGVLCSDISALETLYAQSSAVMVSSISTNFALLVNWHTITRIVSQSCLDSGSSDFGSFTMKSIVTLLYGLVSSCRGCNRL
jgi:hypothetical protein